ncbi:MAG: ABC transporter substrate-binding protein [Desulfovibrionaceae bacterium]
MEQTAATMGLPVYYVRLETISEYAEAFRKVAELTGKQERGELLARHAEDVVAEVDQALAGLRDEDRVSVYYAQGPDGLRTECNRSSHATLIEMAGGRNVQQCDPSSGFGMETVSIEEVVVKDPKVIVAQQPTFTDSLDGDARWALVSAVREGRVHLIPREPFNWFDRPPSFMRVMGLRWLTSLLYPERYAPDMEAETREFYKLFLDINLTDEQVRHILHR